MSMEIGHKNGNRFKSGGGRRNPPEVPNYGTSCNVNARYPGIGFMSMTEYYLVSSNRYWPKEKRTCELLFLLTK